MSRFVDDDGQNQEPDSAFPREAEEAIERIETMLGDDGNRWRFAQDTLESMAEWIREHGRVTERQLKAIDNIESSVLNR